MKRYATRKDAKRAWGFFLYKTELQRQRTFKRAKKRSVFFWIRMKEEEIVQRRILKDLFPDYKSSLTS